jgi:hypothetical protein
VTALAAWFMSTAWWHTFSARTSGYMTASPRQVRGMIGPVNWRVYADPAGKPFCLCWG